MISHTGIKGGTHTGNTKDSVTTAELTEVSSFHYTNVNISHHYSNLNISSTGSENKGTHVPKEYL